MRKLLKHLRPFAPLIAVIFVLLFAQAMADLSLPGYTSNIVNVGVQQHGIDRAVPEAIRAGEFDKLALFMTDAERSQVLLSYALLDKGSLSAADYAKYVDRYPALADGPIYRLTATDKATLDALEPAFIKSIAVVSGIERDGLPPAAAEALGLPAGSDPFAAIAKLPPVQLDAVRGAVASQLSSVPDSLLKGYATTYLSGEYKALGMNVDGIQVRYMMRIGVLMLLLTLGSVACSIAVGYISARIAAGLGRNLRRRLFQRVESFSAAEFDKFSTASLITRSTNDITQIQMVMVMMFRFVIYAPIMGVGGIIKVLNADTSMLWIIAAAVAVMMTIIAIMFAIALPKFKAVQTLMDRLNLVMRESLTGLMVVRAFNTQRHEEKRFDAANQDLTRVNLFVNRAMVFMFPVMMLIMNGVMLLIVWVGAHQVDAGTTQVGDMMAFVQYAVLIIFSFLMVSFVFMMLPRASVSAERVSEVLETEPVIRDPNTPARFDGAKGLVEFRDVSFRYPGAEDDVLKHVTFTAKPGQTTAIIGSTGSGKSTLVNLVPRFYDVTGGRVLVDGVDVREVTQRDLRERIGYVPQRPVLFSGTIESNIRYGNESATDPEVARYAETAQALDFITNTEQGYATPVSQGGTNLSGGQKQRLSIARALAKRPEIYIFDDALSALDYRTDAALRRALRQETSDATVFIVTQRVSTVAGADQIVVLDNGAVAGIGTHKELMEKCGVYREIALSQLSREELAL